MRAIFASLAGLFLMAYVAIWILCVSAMGYVAWEILFDNALNRWFG